MLVTGNLVTSMMNYKELVIFQNAYLQSHTMLVTGNLVTSMIN